MDHAAKKSKLDDGPKPWRVTDDQHERGFVWDSVARRLHCIVKQVAEGSATTSEQKSKLMKFAEALRDGSFALLPLDASDGGPDWTSDVEAEVARWGTAKAFEVSWWFLECYSYRYMLHVTGYFTSNLDPFLQQKRNAVALAEADFMLAAAREPQADFASLAFNSLWGNRSDLSVSSGLVDAEAAKAASGLLLCDQVGLAAAHLAKRKTTQSPGVIMVLDNCGAELLNDLRLAAWLLREGFTVHLHVKAHPTFVSDATCADVSWHVDWLADRLVALHGELTRAQSNGRLAVRDDDFYVSAKPFRDAPAHLKQAYASAALVILKGDANYRRLVADTPRDSTTPLVDCAEIDGSVLAIRTCKSPVIAGLSVESVALAHKANPRKWCLDGSSGVCQFYSRARPACG